MKLNNLIFFAYYLKTTDWKSLRSHRTFIKSQNQISGIKLDIDMMLCTIRYGLSFHEYYYYGLWNKSSAQRSEYASMGYMYKFQIKYNPIGNRTILSDKNKFNTYYSEFIHRDIINPIESSMKTIENFLKEREKVVLKKSNGSQGKFVEVLQTSKYTPEKLKEYAIHKQYDILEEFVYQHDELQRLSPNSLNTIRFITFLKNNNNVKVVGSSIRMGLNKNTDNLSSGGITCKVNIETGVIESKGYSFDITQKLCDVHPISGMKLEGFKIPYWNEVTSMCIMAAKKYSENRCIGWDVAITNNGPLLIEGNHDWGARVWQMPAGKGMKDILDRLSED